MKNTKTELSKRKSLFQKSGEFKAYGKFLGIGEERREVTGGICGMMGLFSTLVVMVAWMYIGIEASDNVFNICEVYCMLVIPQ